MRHLQALQSRGVLTTKIAALVDALGNLVRFTLLAGHRHGSIRVPVLLDGITFGALLGDKGLRHRLATR